MTRVPALCGFVLLLAGCGQQEGPSVDALSADPSRLHLLSGKTGPDEYQTLADLPPIPPSFDEPAEDSNAVATASPVQEDSP